LKTFFDIVWFDYYKDSMLMKPGLQDRIPKAAAEAEAFPFWLRRMAVIAPLVGLVSFLVNSYHVYNFVLARKEEAVSEMQQKQSGDYPLDLGLCVVLNGRPGTVKMINSDPDDALPIKVDFEDGHSDWARREQVQVYVAESNAWQLKQSEELTLLVIMMPAMFVVMAMRAEIRVLEILLGSSFRRGSSWEDYELWRRGTYTMDLECAAAFQYVTVVAFALLCAQFFSIGELSRDVELREKDLILRINKLQRHGAGGEAVESSLSSELQKADRVHFFSLTWAGLQGLWSYVLVGFLRCLLNIVTAGLLELGHGKDMRSLIEVLDKFEPVFVFTTLLCIYNWTIIQRLPDIKRKEALGPRATLKFIAVRLLLLVGDGQRAVLTGMVGKRWLHLTQSKADLLHTSLLLCESFVVVLWNLYMWSDSVMSEDERRRQKRLQRMATAAKSRRATSQQEPLLGSSSP